MWGRFKRMVRANLGRLSELGSGGGLSGDLEREARDLQKQFAELDKSLAMLRGEVTFLEEKGRKLARREEELEAIVKAADQRGSFASSNYGLELERVRTERATVLRQLETCKVALERAQETRRAFSAEREKKLAEARERERAMLQLQREDQDALRQATRGDGAPLGRLADELDLPATRTSGAPAPRTAPSASVLGHRVDGAADDDAVRRWEAEQRAPAAKTVGAASGVGPALTPEEPPAQARSQKTIGPAPGQEPAAPRAEAPAPALKIKVRPAKADEPPAASPVEVEAPRPADVGSAPTPTARPSGAPAPSTRPSGAPAPRGTDLVVELERLARMREQGVLTEEELEQAKRRLLGSGA